MISVQKIIQLGFLRFQISGCRTWGREENEDPGNTEVSVSACLC